MRNKVIRLALSSLVVILIATLLISELGSLRRTKENNEAEEYVQDRDNIYVNTTTEAKSVGSKKCQGCHPDIYDSYSKSEMGRSMARLDTSNIIEEYPQREAVYDSATNFYYEMVRRGEHFYQREYRFDQDGNIIHERWMEAEYVIGSGNNLRMYFHSENGMLYQMPLTWYVHKKSWDLSPGYREFGNLRFARFANAKCISCHNSFMNESPTSNQRYMKPYPLGIGCERCHGPGELHIKEMTGEKFKNDSPGTRTIVNPRKLSPQRQLDVCRQCHLLGKAWALHGESSWFDYRPGRLLESHRSVYFSAKTRKEVFEVADSAQRLSLSRCFKESNGAMTCISCHDPHRSIKTFSIGHYNEKCQTCHSPKNLPREGSKYLHTAADNCLSCHMNRTGTENTLHGVSNTDHWIRIDANQVAIDWSTLKQPVARQPLIGLFADVDVQDEGKHLRKGIAYLDYYREHDSRPAYLDSALIYLSKGLDFAPNDAIGCYHLGEVQLELVQYEEAIWSFEQAIALQPSFADAYFKLGKVFSIMKNPGQALNYYRHAVELKPDEPSYLEGLGNALAAEGNFAEAVTILERSLKIDKQNPYTYYRLGNLYARELQEPKKALSHFQEVVVLDPDFPNGYLNLGNTFALLGDYMGAIKSYENELLVRPGSSKALVNLGQIYKRMGRTADARNAFKKVLKIDPFSNVARQSLNQLPQ